MARKTIYVCDMCKKEKEEKELVKLSATLTGAGIVARSGKADICLDCLRKKGFEVIPGHAAENVEKNSKILEEKLIDILASVGVSFE